GEDVSNIADGPAISIRRFLVHFPNHGALLGDRKNRMAIRHPQLFDLFCGCTEGTFLSQNTENQATIGTFYALGAFGIWGFGPIYFKAITHIGPDEILAHRVLWSFVLVTLFLGLRGRLAEILDAFRRPRLIALMLLTASFVAFNWFVYIWAVHNDRVLDASLGYYINPLLNVVLGAIFLGERLSKIRALAVALATVGVAALVVAAGIVPWAALAMAFSFAIYGLLRKLIEVKPVVGMQLESLVLVPIALAYLVYLSGQQPPAFGQSVFDSLMLVAAGLYTAVPLIFFAEAARRLTLTTVGFLQYIAPTLQFILAVSLYNEAFTTPHAIAFGCIWVALALYSLEGKIRSLGSGRPKAAATP
ncbi:MAG: EamA family transporter RarD, partial [Myxococcota bacterium]